MAPNSLSTCLISMFIVTTFVSGDDCPPACSCTLIKNGKKVDCSSKGIQELRIDRLPRRTVELDLSDNHIRIIRKDSFPVSRSVRRLDLKRNHIKSIEPGALAKFPYLVKLYLQVNQLKRIDQGTFSGIRYIKQLNISQNKLVDIHQYAFSPLRKLKKISLKQNRLTTFKEYTFPNNSKIELDGNELICDCGISWLVAKSANRRLGATMDTVCSFPKALAGTRLKRLGGRKWNCRAKAFELPGFAISPDENQVVFQNDSFALKCSSLWQPRGHLVWKVDKQALNDISIKEMHDMDSRKNESVLIIKRASLHHNGIYSCRAVMGNGMETVKEVSLNVIGWETKFCPLQHISTEKGKFSWHTTVSGAVATTSCPFDDRRIATRRCEAGKWELPDTGGCLYRNLLTRTLDALSKRDVNQTSLPQIFYDLTSITKQYQRNFTEVKQLHYIVKIFASIGAAKLPMRKQLQQEVRKGMAKIFTSVISMEDAVFSENDIDNGKTLSGLLPVLEKFMKDSLDHELRSRTEDVPVVLPVTSKVAAYSRSYIYTPEFQYNLVCSVLFKNVTYPNQGTVGECSKAMNTSNIPEGFDSQIVIPSDLFSLVTPYKRSGPYQLINVTFIGYKSPELFADSKLTGIKSKMSNTTINSAVMGILVQVPGMKNADIVSSIVMSFKHFKAGKHPRLVYWTEYKNPAGKNLWLESTKCKLITERQMHSKFMCSELPGRMTYFALIMEITKETNPIASFDLEFVTHVGAGICALFLLLTFITYATFRELRYNRNDAATLMNLCLALIVAIILFVTGINRIDNLLLCKAFAVLLHYFLLCCLLWVGCGGACMTILVRKGLDKEEYNPVLKYYLIAWGVPMIVCGITLAGNTKNYNIANYCWLTPQASIGAFIIPGGLIVTINTIIFLRLHNLVNRKFPEPVSNRSPNEPVQAGNCNSKLQPAATNGDFHFPDRSELLDFVKGSLLVMLILCIDCGFVVMIFVNRKGSSRYLYHIFSYGFAIANMILGLSVFIFHCVRREDVHVCWRSLFKWRKTTLNVENHNEIEALLEPLTNPILTIPLRSNGLVSKLHSEQNNEQSDIISALSAAHSHFTHDVPSSRPSSIFGPSAGDSKSQGKQGIGRLTLPTYENNKPIQRASESESASQQVVPSAPPHPLTGFAPYPPSTIPDTTNLVRERSIVSAIPNGISQNTATPDFTITTVSERTFSDGSNLHSDIRSAAKQFETVRENVVSDHSSVLSHKDPGLRGNQKPCVPLRNIVAPNWKPVRHGGSSAVFYPYVDQNFKSLQSPGQNSLNSVLTSSTQQQQQQQAPPAMKGEALPTMGPFTIPHRSEGIGATNSNKTPSLGNQTDQDQIAKRQSDTEVKKLCDKEAHPRKVERIRRSRTSSRRRRMRSRTRFEDLPVEKCLIYVPLIEEQEQPAAIGNETSV